MIESGYLEPFNGTFVPKEKAFDYAIKQCIDGLPDCVLHINWKQEFKDMLIEWFYSSWVYEDGNKTYI